MYLQYLTWQMWPLSLSPDCSSESSLPVEGTKSVKTQQKNRVSAKNTHHFYGSFPSVLVIFAAIWILSLSPRLLPVLGGWNWMKEFSQLMCPVVDCAPVHSVGNKVGGGWVCRGGGQTNKGSWIREKGLWKSHNFLYLTKFSASNEYMKPWNIGKIWY